MSLQFEKLNVPSAYQVVSRELRRMILRCDLKTGEQLPTEAQLAEHFGVNRSTAREGIRQLENEGFVRRGGGKRLCVTVPDQRDLAPRAIRTLVMQQNNVPSFRFGMNSVPRRLAGQTVMASVATAIRMVRVLALRTALMTGR